MSWSLVSIGDVAEILSGNAWKSSQFTHEVGDRLPIIRIQNVTDKVTDLVYWDGPVIDKYLVENGDLLLSLSGNVKLCEWPFGNALLNQRVVKIEPSARVDKRYLYWALSKVVSDIGAMARHAVIANVSVVDLKAFKISLPPLSEQRRIAAILDKADAIRRKRQQAIQLADDFLRAVFLDMFGDPVTNPKGWPITTLPDLSEKFTDGPFGSNLKSSHYVEGGIRVIRLQNIGVGVLLNNDLAFISEKHYQSLPRHHCRPGDVMIGTLGEPNLRACIIPETLDRALNKADCLLLRPLPNKALSEYICWLLNSPSLVSSAAGLVRGQTRGRISLGRLKGLEVPLPPLNEQKKFREVVRKLFDVQESVESSSRAVISVASSLSQAAFSGRL